MTIPSPALTEELTLRWNKLQQLMHESHADGLLISDNVNLFYVSGHIFRGYCYLPATGLPIFFVRRPLGWEGPQIVYIRKPEDIRDYFTQHGIPFPENLLLESDSISYSDYKRYEAIFTPKEISNGTTVLRRCRSIKTPYEIEQMRQSGKLHAKAYAAIPALYRPGMTDLDFSISSNTNAASWDRWVYSAFSAKAWRSLWDRFWPAIMLMLLLLTILPWEAQGRMFRSQWEAMAQYSPEG